MALLKPGANFDAGDNYNTDPREDRPRHRIGQDVRQLNPSQD